MGLVRYILRTIIDDIAHKNKTSEGFDFFSNPPPNSDICKSPPYKRSHEIFYRPNPNYNFSKLPSENSEPPYVSYSPDADGINQITGNCDCSNLDQMTPVRSAFDKKNLAGTERRNFGDGNCFYSKYERYYLWPRPGSPLLEYGLEVDEFSMVSFTPIFVGLRPAAGIKYNFAYQNGGSSANASLCCVSNFKKLESDGGFGLPPGTPIPGSGDSEQDPLGPIINNYASGIDYLSQSGIGVLLWFDPFDSASLQHSGDYFISGWNSSTGFNEASLTSPINHRPYANQEINNIPLGLSFYDNNILSGVFDQNALPLSGNISYCIVAQIEGVNDASDSLISYDSDLYQTFDFNAGNTGAFYGNIETSGFNTTNNNNNNELLNQSGSTIAGPSIYSLIFDYDNQEINLRVDGTTKTQNLIDYNIGLTGSGSYFFGSGLSGAIGDIFVLSGSGFIEDVEGVLAHKWNLQNNLPASHPHKKNPPYVES